MKRLIKNLDKLLSIETGMPVYIADEPLDCVVRGAGKTLDDATITGGINWYYHNVEVLNWK